MPESIVNPDIDRPSTIYRDKLSYIPPIFLKLTNSTSSNLSESINPSEIFKEKEDLVILTAKLRLFFEFLTILNSYSVKNNGMIQRPARRTIYLIVEELCFQSEFTLTFLVVCIPLNRPFGFKLHQTVI